MTNPTVAPTPAPRRRASRAPLTSRRARRWVMIVAALLAVVPVLVSLANLTLSSEVSPGLALASAIVWSLYTIPFLIVIRRIDYFEREPWSALVAAFLWGGLVAGGMALMANDALFEIVTVRAGVVTAQDWGAAIAGPTTEEAAKGIGVLLILMTSPRRPRTALDGFVIGAVVGLGFQVVENFGYTMNVSALTDDPGAEPLVQMFIVRGLLSGAFSHAVYTGIVGLGLGYLVTASGRSWARRIGVALLAFVGAYFAHWLWNSPLLLPELGVGSLLVKGLITLTILITGLVIARTRDSQYFVPALAEVPEWLCSPAERDALSSAGSRRRARRAAKRAGGGAAGRATRTLQRAQADLAVAVRVGDQAGVDNAVARIVAARARLPRPAVTWAPPVGPPVA